MALSKADTAMEASQPAEYILPTIRQQLQQRKDALQREMDSIDDAIKLMDENPTFEKVHDAISKVRGIR